MSDIAIGDRVLAVGSSVGNVEASPIYVMPHALKSGLFHFKRIMTASNHSLTLTPDHYMLIADPGHAGQWSYRRAVVARQVKPGDGIWVYDDQRHVLIETWIEDIKDVLEEGIFAPFTLTGNIIVNDVVASVYNDMLGSESNMHAFCAWGRHLWGYTPQLFTALHSRGWASPMSMGIGHMAKAVVRLTSMTLMDSTKVA